MLLRIVDQSDKNNADTQIQIVLEDKAEIVESYLVEDYITPFSKNFHKQLNWYFSDYAFVAQEPTDDRGVGERLLKFGQYMGDQLMGEDQQLMKVVHKIEQESYQQLEVQIESSRYEFFAEPWEFLVLPESKYTLAAASKNFVRKVIGADSKRDLAELSYGLKVKPPIVNSLAGFDVNQASPQSGDDKPLRILHLVSRKKTDKAGAMATASDAYNCAIKALAAENAISYRILPTSLLTELESCFNEAGPTVHIVHYDGPIEITPASIRLFIRSSSECDEHLDFRTFCKWLAEKKVAVLCMDTKQLYSDSSDCNSDSPPWKPEVLAEMAEIALNTGIGNLISLGYPASPWISAYCFTHLYQKIVTGLELGQAVVETRKLLQTQLETSRFTSKPQPFQSWPLLTHYGGQSVEFFELPQTITELGESQALATATKKLLGFRHSMFPPSSLTTSDNGLLQLIEAVEQGHSSLALIGAAGIGKTHVAHQFCLYMATSSPSTNCRLDWAFYFDFDADMYTSNVMLKMIAPVLEINMDDAETVPQKLKDYRCCFVLDNILGLNKEKDNWDWGELSRLLMRLKQDGHLIVATGVTCDSPLDLEFEAVYLGPLSEPEQAQLCAEILRKNDLIGKDQASTWREFLFRLHGNPFLIKYVLPLLKEKEPETLQTEIGSLFNDNASDVVTTFYQWQWSLLPIVWQQLLLLASTVEGLLLETLMIACDQKENFSPAQSLLEVLGDKDVKVAEGLERLNAAGFIQYLPHARIIESRCQPFLKEKLNGGEFQHLASEKICLNFSHVVCEGIRLLSNHVINQQNTALSHNLLSNRRSWVEHFERLWFNHEYRQFIATKNAFDQVLQQAKLSEEMAAWSLDLLKRSSPVSVGDNFIAEAKLSWLNVAISALSTDNSTAQEVILNTEKNWRMWFDSLEAATAKEQMSLFLQVATFLQHYYQAAKHWEQGLKVAQKAYNIYILYQAWHQAIAAAKYLARCSTELQRPADTLKYEDNILTDISYEGAPPGFRLRQFMEILVTRVARVDLENAQVLLDRINGDDESKQFKEVLDEIQADIFYRQQRYTEALPYYCKLWKKAVRSQQKQPIEHLRTHFNTLRENLGEREVEKVYSQTVEGEFVKPWEPEETH